MFQLAGHAYEITEAQLTIIGRLEIQAIRWGVRITTKGTAGADDLRGWNPAILAERLLETKAGQLSHWYDIAGTTIAWDTPDEDPRALFETHETTALYACKWQFISVPENKRVQLILDGLVDIDADDEKVPVHVDTMLAMAPWPMAFRPEEECFKRYQQLGLKDPVAFRVGEDGVSTLVFLNQ